MNYFSSLYFRVIQRNENLYDVNIDVSNAYLPSSFGNLWDPEEAFKNSTNREIRVGNEIILNQWDYGQIGDTTIISGTYSYGGYLRAEASPTLSQQLYRGTIQYIYFLIRK